MDSGQPAKQVFGRRETKILPRRSKEALSWRVGLRQKKDTGHSKHGQSLEYNEEEGKGQMALGLLMLSWAQVSVCALGVAWTRARPRALIFLL